VALGLERSCKYEVEGAFGLGEQWSGEVETHVWRVLPYAAPVTSRRPASSLTVRGER
jgi:hypothetical protein